VVIRRLTSSITPSPRADRSTESLSIVALDRTQWPALETLFGPRGACGGCWCMWWRVARGGALWEATKGERAKSQFRALVDAGRARGLLAFQGSEPVGWCTFGPRREFPRLDRVRAYQRAVVEQVWSIPCFYVARQARGRGVAHRLLSAAVAACRRAGADIVEGYPVTLTRKGKRLPPAFSHTGPLILFKQEGFEVVQALSPSKPLVRLRLGARRRR
jgi:GNAT superfamily N-acetyltransferase